MSVILVTGGTGLVGNALQHVLETEPEGSRFGKRPGERWVCELQGNRSTVSVTLTYFQLDLKQVSCRDPVQTTALFQKYKPTHVIHLAAIGASKYELF